MNLGAQKLTELVDSRGSQALLADELGMAQGYLSRLARAERLPGLGVRRKLVPLGIELGDWETPIKPKAR